MKLSKWWSKGENMLNKHAPFVTSLCRIDFCPEIFLSFHYFFYILYERRNNRTFRISKKYFSLTVSSLNSFSLEYHIMMRQEKSNGLGSYPLCTSSVIDFMSSDLQPWLTFRTSKITKKEGIEPITPLNSNLLIPFAFLLSTPTVNPRPPWSNLAPIETGFRRVVLSSKSCSPITIVAIWTILFSYS